MLKWIGAVAGAFLFVASFSLTLHWLNVHYPHVKYAMNPANSTVIVRMTQGHGSGVYVGNGLVLTAAHVAKEAVNNNWKMTVEDIWKTKADATVLWYNEQADVALLKLDAPLVNDKGIRDMLPASKLACETPDVTIGNVLEVIGAPLNLTYIHTYGRVAGAVEERTSALDKPQTNFIANIVVAPGNSGGPAFDDQGNLVGIVVAMAVAPLDAGIGVAIPSVVGLTYIIPKSVLCHEMAAKHDAPTQESK